MSNLLNISPVDGRYRELCEEFAEYFSEYGFMKYRLLIELKYFIELINTFPELGNINTNKNRENILNIFNNFNLKEALLVKNIDKRVNHDVKSIEYYIKDKLLNIGLSPYYEYIHIGLTSQDINNTFLPLVIKESLYNQIIPIYNDILNRLKTLGKKWINIPMLCRTHGQPASPSFLGKEILVFYERIQIQVDNLKTSKFYGKFGGAVGNFNSLYLTFPDIDWLKFGDDFLNKLGLNRSQFTKQIDHYDSLCNIFNIIRTINNILIDFNQDIWLYISLNYFKLKINKDEIGSSTMPHKVNPINFENSEGNLQLSNSLLNFLSNKLPISRLQRDLTDSTVTRNIGMALSYSYISYKSLIKGLDKLEVNKQVIDNDLNSNWIIICEAIQTVLKKYKYPKPYELLKDFSRNNEFITKEKIHDFIKSLNLDEKIKMELLKITPFNYTGIIPNI